MSALYGWLLIAGIVTAAWLYLGRPWFTWLHPGELAALWSYPLAGRDRRRWFRGLMSERKEADFERRVAAAKPKTRPAGSRFPAVGASWHVSAKFSLHASGSFELGRPPAPEPEEPRPAPPVEDGKSWDGWVPTFGSRHSCARGNYLNLRNCPEHGGAEKQPRPSGRVRIIDMVQREAAAQREIDLAVRQVQQSAEEVHRAAAGMARRVASGELGERRLTMYPDPLNIAFEEVRPGFFRLRRRPRSGTSGGRQW